MVLVELGMLEAMLAVIAIPPAVLSICFAIEVAAGLRPLSDPDFTREPSTASAVVIIPAHNEEASIAATIASLRSEASGLAELLVVADNCTDRTEAIATAGGARAIARNDPSARGKGHALAFARTELAKDPPAIVLVIDADCRMDRKSIASLIDASITLMRPSQAINLLRPDLAAAPFVQASNFAFLLRNLIRQRGLWRLARRVHLTGTGMALPWTLFAEAKLGGASIVEDLELGLSLSACGHAPILVEQATVWSSAAPAASTLQQRERWEGGFIRNGLPAGVGGIVRNIAKLDGRGLVGAIDLCIPPLALLGLLDTAALTISGLAAILGVVSYPFVTVAAASSLAGLAVVIAWVCEGRRYASFGALARLPLYIMRKVPMYTRILTRGAPRDWVRTDRVE
jgi:hypothetical protein